MGDMNVLLKEIEEFCAEYRLSSYTFGYKAVKNGRLVERLKNGGRIWPENEKAVREFMDNYRQNSKKGMQHE